VKASIKQEIGNAKHISFTSDGWTSDNNLDGFISLTGTGSGMNGADEAESSRCDVFSLVTQVKTSGSQSTQCSVSGQLIKVVESLC